MAGTPEGDARRAPAAAMFKAGLSSAEVASQVGVSLSAVQVWRRKWKAGGPEALARPADKHPLVPLGTREAQVLEGLMLGDGCLTRSPNSRNPTLSVTRTSRDGDYQAWLAEVFASRMAPVGVRVHDVHDARTGKTYASSRLRTRADSALADAYRRWYPQGSKVVPEDVALTDLTVAIWLADDGSVTEGSRRSPALKFATHSFALPEVTRLAGLLADRFGPSVTVRPAGPPGQFVIHVFGDTAKALLRSIDRVFPPLARKSDIWRKSELLDDKPDRLACTHCSSTRTYYYGRNNTGRQKGKCLDCRRTFMAPRPLGPATPEHRKEPA